MLTAKEHREFMYFCRRYPIDDESNFQMPIAALHASFRNANSSPNSSPVSMQDMMLFAESPDVESQLLSQGW